MMLAADTTPLPGGRSAAVAETKAKVMCDGHIEASGCCRVLKHMTSVPWLPSTHPTISLHVLLCIVEQEPWDSPTLPHALEHSKQRRSP